MVCMVRPYTYHTVYGFKFVDRVRVVMVDGSMIHDGLVPDA